MEYVSNEPSQIQTEFLSLHILPCNNVVEIHEFVQRLELDLKKQNNPALFNVNVTNYSLTYSSPSPTSGVAPLKNSIVGKQIPCEKFGIREITAAFFQRCCIFLY
jgi:hypothetical protein